MELKLLYLDHHAPVVISSEVHFPGGFNEIQRLRAFLSELLLCQCTRGCRLCNIAVSWGAIQGFVKYFDIPMVFRMSPR